LLPPSGIRRPLSSAPPAGTTPGKRAGDVGPHAGGFLEDGLKKLSLRDLGVLRFLLRFRIQRKMEDRLRVDEAIVTARIVVVVFDRLPQKHPHLDQPLHIGVHHGGHVWEHAGDYVVEKIKVSE
jgi:hypothetical protein